MTNETTAAAHRNTVEQLVRRGPTPNDSVCPNCGANGHWVPCMKKYVCYKNHAHVWLAYHYDLVASNASMRVSE